MELSLKERAKEENGKRKDYKGSFLFLCYGLVRVV